jgi:predicted small lipoprotein YifL
MRNRPTSWLLCLALSITLVGAALAGCGQRGPLYLPDDTEQDATR